MQETYNNCFGSKKHNTTLLPEKIGKHESPKITATYWYWQHTDNLITFLMFVVVWRILLIDLNFATVFGFSLCCYFALHVLTCFCLKEGRYYSFSIQNNSCIFFGSDIILERVHHSYYTQIYFNFSLNIICLKYFVDFSQFSEVFFNHLKNTDVLKTPADKRTDKQTKGIY